MRHYFLGMSANRSRKERLRHTFCVGRDKDCNALEEYLSRRYNGETILTKNGRSALALALKAYFEPGDAVLINGFTCYAVYEAIKAARLVPIFVDITKEDLNFSEKTISNAILVASRASSLAPVVTGLASSIAPVVANALESAETRIKGIIIQNTLGNPVDITKIEKLAEKHGLTIIEDLAHSAGVKYSDGREAGTVGSAAVFSFGKDKSIDTISGGALVLRDSLKHKIQAPSNSPKPSDHLRARFYPLFGAICRGLSYLHLGGAFMRFLVKIHFVERSADNKLDLTRKISKFEAKLALEQFKALKKTGEKPIREFYLINNRNKVLKILRKNGYYFEGFWYERPVSPERYYKKVHFDEEACPNAVEVSKTIVNIPTYYTKKELEPAIKIIKSSRKEAN